MTTKTPEQLEDAAVTDVLSTIVGLRLKEQKRQLLNHLRTLFEPEIVSARLNGREIDMDKFTVRVLRAVREFDERN